MMLANIPSPSVILNMVREAQRQGGRPRYSLGVLKLTGMTILTLEVTENSNWLHMQIQATPGQMVAITEAMVDGEYHRRDDLQAADAAIGEIAQIALMGGASHVRDAR